MPIIPKSDLGLVKDVVPDWNLAEQLFNVRYKYAVKHASGMERLAIKVLPRAVLRSISLTLDPQTPFRLATMRVTTANRSRKRRKTNVGKQRFLMGSSSQFGMTEGFNCFTCLATKPSVSQTASVIKTVLTSRPDYTEEMKDTSAATRPVYSDKGTAESFSFSVFSPERTVQWSNTYYCFQPCPSTCQGSGVKSTSNSYETRWTVGGHAYFSASDVAALRSASISRVNSEISKHLSSMVGATLPSGRKLTIFRSVAELKDLPRSISSLRETLFDLNRGIRHLPKSLAETIFNATTSKHVPQEWLSYWFAWRTTYQDVKKLLESPEKIAKHVNFLISRQGKPTTLHFTKKVPGEGATTPAFTVQPTGIFWSGGSDNLLSTVTDHRWDTELKLSLNLNFEFPTVGVPRLRHDLLVRKYGLLPTPTDLYNLVPWTWLVDWFTGLGNYVEMIDNINTDPKLINWAMITGVQTGLIATHATCEYTPIRRVCTSTYTSSVKRVYTSRLEYKTHVRKDVGSVLGVRKTLEPPSLTAYQQSIIGAILAARSGFTRN